MLAALVALAVVACVGAAVGIEHVGMAPRTLAPYIAKRTSGHNPAIEAAGRVASGTLMALDRGGAVDPALPGLTLGAQPLPANPGTPVGTLVNDPDALRGAVAHAQPGDVITLAPGTYRFTDRPIDANRPGSADAPIVVRASQPGTVVIEFNLVEGFRVSAPYWRFENLTIRGTCVNDSDCEHAFHVVGAARHFASVNNSIADFNAQFKINGMGDDFPDDGLIEANTLFDTRVRHTPNPVTPIDLVAANRWTIRANIIKDFAKDEGNFVTYGAFAKGAGSANVFERNLVWCEDQVRGVPGQRVGLSLGGGGTGAEYCRDRKCVVEQQGSTLRSNLIAACSDVGIYLNSAADSRVEDNTLVDTTGIDVRFPTSSARIDGNLVDGPVRARNGGIVHLGANEIASVWPSYLGIHKVRDLFAAPRHGDFTWRTPAPRRDSLRKGIGLCGGGPVHVYGAFEDFRRCKINY